MEIFIEKAKEVLLKNKIEIGVKAGAYYPEFWIRDFLISSLGMISSEDRELIKIVKKGLDTISRHQKFIGQLPNKISLDEQKICFGEGGCVDSSLWYPIVILNLFKVKEDFNFLKKHYRKINRAMSWAISLDQNNDFLIETNEGADWMDLLLRSGRVLYDNVLLYKALKDADEINMILGKGENFSFFAENLKEAINLLLWPDKKNSERVKLEYGFSCINADFETAINAIEKANYYLADLGFRKFDPRFDSLGNLLAVIFDVADEEKKDKILNFIEKEKLYEPYPVKSLHPPIYKTDPFWNFYFRWTNLPYLQEPGNYHNGGIWPFIGGFYIIALKKENKPWEDKFYKLVESCKLENWRFSEWLSADGKAKGSANQSWSASSLLYSWYY
jgi:glycogen debranching enzyme